MFFLLQAKCIVLNNSASFQHFSSKLGQIVVKIGNENEYFLPYARDDVWALPEVNASLK
jgi:hypothetical protein